MISADDLDSSRAPVSEQPRELPKKVEKPKPKSDQPREGANADKFDYYENHHPESNDDKVKEEVPEPREVKQEPKEEPERTEEPRRDFKSDWHTFPYKDTFRLKDFSHKSFKKNERSPTTKRLPLDGADTWHAR